MSSIGKQQTLLVEMFPVNVEVLPELFAYRLQVKSGNFPTVGGKLSYRFKKKLSGYWAWAGGFVVTDTPPPDQDIQEIIKSLWAEQPDTFKGLEGVTLVQNWTPSPRAIAEFVTRALLENVEKDIKAKLRENQQNLGNDAYVKRVHAMRGWAVQGKPAVSISISSRLIYRQDLRAYATRASDMELLLGLWVSDKSSTMKGEIESIEGTLAQSRDRLISITSQEETKTLIENAPDEELVVKVRSGRNEYEYIAGALNIILKTEYFKQFGIDSRKALSILKIEPDLRSKLVSQVADIAKTSGFLGDGFNSHNSSNSFISRPNIPQVMYGRNQAKPFNERRVLQDLKSHGFYRLADRFKSQRTIRVGIINALGSRIIDAFWKKIEAELRGLKFEVDVVGEENISDSSRATLDIAIQKLGILDIDALVAFFPDGFSDDDDEAVYNHFKSLAIARGIPSQVIEKSTLRSKWAFGNIILGLLGKTGNIPYILANPIDFADMVVGIDIARERKKRLEGSINATAIARIYLNDGEFLQYAIHDAPIEGETVPTTVLQGLFPQNIFSNKRVVIHRDGYFRGNEKQALKDWAQKIGATFYFVEVIKSGAPRVYALEQNNGKWEARQPAKGTAFKLSPTEAFLVSSLPPFDNATPMPIHVKTEAPLTIEQAIDSILDLTVLHYGSMRPPRLPISIHYSDKIAYLVLRGIKPRSLEGNIPYWL